MKKFNILWIGVLVLSSGLRAATVSDDFNRADTSYSTNGATIGTGWQNASSADFWKINSGSLFFNASVSPTAATLYNTTYQTISGNGASFSVSADVSAGVMNGYAGVVFHYQNPSNYYVLRIKGGSATYQMIRVVDGANANLMVNKSDATAPFAAGTKYTMTVSSDTAHAFNFTIKAVSNPTALNPTATVTDALAGQFSGGYAGLHCPTFNAVDPDASFDNFTLESVVPALGLYVIH